MSDKIRAILIDPKLKLITEVQIGTDLQDIYNQLGVDVIDLARVGEKDWLIVDDLGTFRKEQHSFVTPTYNATLVNRALLMGDQESTTWTLEEARALIAFEA